MQVSFPMTDSGWPSYTAPASLDEARKVMDDKRVQNRATNIIQTTEDVVSLLRNRNDDGGRSPVVAQIPNPERDLNPDPNLVVISGSSVNFSNGLPMANNSSEALLELRAEPASKSALADVERLQLRQTDGLHIDLTREGTREVIRYGDLCGEATLIRDWGTGCLTVLWE